MVKNRLTILMESRIHREVYVRFGGEHLQTFHGNMKNGGGCLAYEFLGVVEAVKYIIAHNYSPRVIYTDSQTAIAWFNAKRTASKKRNPALLKAEVFLKAFAAEVETIEVKHWDNREWGEIPADFNEK